MIDANIYYNAAQRIIDGSSGYCCLAIEIEKCGLFLSEIKSSEEQLFDDLFNPHDICTAYFSGNEDDRLTRSLALLFIYEMEK